MPLFSSETDKGAHERFVKWIDANPGAYVINRRGPEDMTIHRASCGHFKPYDWANQTTNVKACSLDRIKLENWSEVEGVARLKKCSDCM